MQSIDAVLSEVPAAQASTLAAAKPIVVVIEDDYRSALALVMLMEDWGYTCIAGRSSHEAALTLGSRLTRVAAIVTDLNLGGVLRGIKDAKGLAAAIGHVVPTIVTTGFGDIADQASEFPVLRKPFDPNMLRTWLEYKIRK